MKFTKLTLNESISDENYSVVDHTIAQAERFRQKKVDAFDAAMKDRKLETPNEEKDAHSNIKTPEMKKMYLSEALFREWIETEFYVVRFDEDGNNLNDTFEDKDAAIRYAKDNLSEGPVVYFVSTDGTEEIVWTMYDDSLDEDVDSRKELDRVLAAVDEGELEAKNVLLACLKYMSEDEIADMCRANEFFHDAEILEEDMDGYTLQTSTGTRFKYANMSNLSGEIQVVVPELTLVYTVSDGTQYDRHETVFEKDSLARLYLTDESRDAVEVAFKDAITRKLAEAGHDKINIGGSALVDVPRYVEIYESDATKVVEGIDGNSSHADEFIKALRSAGFGDGFDQKLKIDQYSTGTRIEYKDQGGNFIVTITDEKVTLEGHDEGEEPFKKEFSTWADFAKEFQDLYPGIPVHENKTLVEARKLPAMISTYEREDGARYLVYKTREPLAYVIEAELTSGEICYLEKNNHVTQSVMPHKDYPVSQVSVQWDEWEMPFVKVWGPSKEYFEAAIEVAKKYGKDYEIHLDKYARGRNKFWLEIILTDEDTEEPYFDPEAPVYTSSKKSDDVDADAGNTDDALTGRHMKDNEDLEDSQRYPVESPQPAQTGLAMLEDLDASNIDHYDILNWLAEHEQAEADAKAFFAPTELYDLTSQELTDWICEHDQLCADFYEEFKDLLVKKELTEDVMMNGALNEVRISTEGIRNFKPWEGAIDTFNKILEAGKMDAFESQLEDEYPEGIGATELNDMLWFDKDAILNSLGIED